MLDSFWNSTDSCLKTMMYSNEEFKQLNNTPLKYCGLGAGCFVNGSTVELLNQPLLFEDYKFLFKDKYVHDINHGNLSIEFKSKDHFMQMMYRLILNPTKDIQDMVFQQLSTYPANFTGMHIRSGGKLANNQEIGYWLTEKELPDLASFINNTIINKDLSKVIYLTTDSDKIEQHLRSHLPQLTILIRPPIILRDHSTSFAKANAIKGALFDAFLTAQSSSILYTRNSKYSQLLLSLANYVKSFSLPSTFRVAKSINDIE